MADFEFSTDPSDAEDSWRKIVEEAIEKWHKKELEKETGLQPGADSKRRKRKCEPNGKDWLFRRLKDQAPLARQYLAWVIFMAALARFAFY